MDRLLISLCLGGALCLAGPARADDAADRVAEATKLVNRTLIKNLQTGFGVAVDKTVAPMPEARAAAVRKDLDAEFERQRAIMVEGLAKDYADKFTLAELKHLDGIYTDPTYQKFQALNADPNASVAAISQTAVTKLLNMLAVAAATDGTPPVPTPPAQPPVPAPDAK